MKKTPTVTIQKKLTIIFLVLSLTPLTVLSVLAYKNGRDALKENIDNASKEKAFQAIDKIDRLLYFSQRNIQSWSNAEIMQDALTDDIDGRITQELIRLKKDYRIYSSLFCANVQGQIIASSEPRMIGQDASKEQWFQQAMRNVESTIGELTYKQNTGGFSMDFSTPITAAYEPTRIIGVLSAGMNWSELYAITSSIEVIKNALQNESGYVVLTDKNGLFLSGPDFLLMEENALASKNFFDAHFPGLPPMLLGQKGTVVTRDIRGNETLAGYAISKGYEDFKGLGWKVIVIQSARDAFQPVKRFQWQLLTMGIFVTTLVLYLSFLISRRISLSIQRLNDAAVALAEGDFSTRVIRRSNDEIGQLADSFNKMSEDLERSMAQIQRQNQELTDKESKLSRMLAELQQSSEELKQTQGQLVQAEKLASIGQLAAGVAHEINNPLGFISSNIEILREYIQNYAEILRRVKSIKDRIQEGDIERIRQAVAGLNKFEEEINLGYILEDINKLLKHSGHGLERIKKIVMDLRTFAREEQTEIIETVRVEEIMDGILNIVQSELKYKAELTKDYGDTPLVQCSSSRMGQVFINLLINAAQAIETKGNIIIKTYALNDYVCVDVTDTGKGIPPDNLSKIFDPFFTTKPIGQGTGLGLSVSYEIMKKHGGEIKVKSKVGKGTTFTVMLPLTEIPAAEKG